MRRFNRFSYERYEKELYQYDEEQNKNHYITRDKRKYNRQENENSNSTKDIKQCCFCTIVSKDYLIKILAFYYSLERHSKNFHLWICCIDDDIYSSLSKINLKNASIIHLNISRRPAATCCKKYEKDKRILLDAKSSRCSLCAYAF